MHEPSIYKRAWATSEVGESVEPLLKSPDRSNSTTPASSSSPRLILQLTEAFKPFHALQFGYEDADESGQLARGRATCTFRGSSNLENMQAAQLFQLGILV